MSRLIDGEELKNTFYNCQAYFKNEDLQRIYRIIDNQPTEKSERRAGIVILLQMLRNQNAIMEALFQILPDVSVEPIEIARYDLCDNMATTRAILKNEED